MANKKTGLFISLAAVLALFVFLGVGLTLNPRDVPSPLLNKPAPEFSLPALLQPGETFSNQDLLGTPSLVNVWATWCPSCRAEHDVLLEIAKTGKVQIFGIGWKDDSAKAKQWLNTLGNPYKKTGDDPSGYTGIDFGVYGAPETYLIDGKGVIVHKHTGPVTWQDWTDTLLPLIDRLAHKPVS